MTNPIFETIKQQLQANDVVVYMKGTSEIPMCGFSAAVVQILNNLGINFTAYNVLENDDIRQGIKEYNNWPTIPQLFIKGEFVGGCDIVREMYQSGELQSFLKEKQIQFKDAA
ncbi:MAG: Grx4 family monothiol glutaredoxin [Alphaproteobacteria bacterium]|nr:Grx4 family monothiol glutaredoxin [Alphaproteobacteria bacterium]